MIANTRAEISRLSRACLLLCAGVSFIAANAGAADWEWRASAGGEINPASHGVVDLGIRKGAFSAQLFTDTLDIRYAPSNSHGRYWIGARGEAYAAGLFVSPWTAGAPDPARALNASYAGVDGGWILYDGRFYFGVQGSERVYFFSARDTTKVPVPGPTSLLTLEGVVGHYQEDLRLWVRAGVDVEGISVALPHVQGELVYRPVHPLAPILELRAGWARRQTDLTRTRLGGLNPYVVPLAGAGWAEFRVENFAAARLGLTWMTKWTEVGPVIDAAAFDDGVQAGLGLLARGRLRRFFAEVSGGYAPWIQRQEGVGRLSLWVLVGAEWGGFKRNAN